MHPAYLKARMDDVRARESSAGSLLAREDRSAILGALADLGLPENSYVRDPSRPRSALYLYRADDGHHQLAAVPWRFARHAPPGMLPEDVREVGRDLRCGLIWCLLGVAASCLVAFVGSLLVRIFVPAVPPESLSPAAYLQAAPLVAGCVAILCAFAAVWHAWALLFPRGALRSTAESRAAHSGTDLSKPLPADPPDRRSTS